MAKRYAIWDKTSTVITPSGEIFTPDEWKVKFPVAGLDTITVVCSAGEINGGFFGTLGQMRQMCEAGGADFSACTTPEEILNAIEAFEDARNTPVETVSTDERIAAALEAQVLMAMPDETTGA